MRTRLLASLACLTCAVSAGAGPLVYVISNAQQFGTVDLSSGAFQPIGSSLPEGSGGLVGAPNGSLLTLAFSGNLDSINPVDGMETLVGPTGLGACVTGIPPECGPNSANTVGQFGGAIYATDFANNLYSINPATGQDHLIGATGIPGIPFLDGSQNADGSINVADEDLFGFNGNFYAYFEAIAIDPSGPLPVVVSVDVAPSLYRINPSTGAATFLTSAPLTLTAAANVNGTIYAFDGSLGEVLALNPNTGATTFVSTLDPNAAIVAGAAATPEPASFALSGLGIGGLIVFTRRRSRKA
jgi:predicted outer membrane repeat protein